MREILSHPSQVTFCGYRAIQVWEDFYLWERLLNDHPHLDGIVELGTAYGGFALYLTTQAQHRGMRFATFDKVDYRTAPLHELFDTPSQRPPVASLNAPRRVVDVLGDEPAPAVIDAIGTTPIALLCDNGNKPKEVALYAPILPVGSLCVVHDWCREIGPADIPICLAERYGALCDEIGSWSRVFARV